jgi:hypothetical protein
MRNLVAMRIQQMEWYSSSIIPKDMDKGKAVLDPLPSKVSTFGHSSFPKQKPKAMAVWLQYL